MLKSISGKQPLGVQIVGRVLMVAGCSVFAKIILLLLLPEQQLFNFLKQQPLNTYEPLFGLGMISLGKNLLLLKEWARRVTIWLLWASLVFQVGLALLYSSYAFPAVVLITAFLIVLNYLSTSTIKERFKAPELHKGGNLKPTS